MRFAETGFNLEINLSRGSIDRVATDPAATAEHLGGQGSAAKLILDRVRPGTEPFSPDNLLVFSAGLLDATPVPGANRTSVCSIGPETNRFASSGLDGFFGTELKHAGYDAVVIRGRSRTPVYIFINNGQVELRDASHLVGKSALQTAALIQEELKSSGVQVAAIGPAGENRVMQATIDHFNSSASEGLGAVMGDKGLKAVAVRGTGEVLVARPADCFQSALEKHLEIKGNPRCGDLLLHEEDSAPAPLERVAGFWTRQRQDEWAVEVQSEHVFYQWENYSQEMEEVHETVVDRSRLLRGTGCYNCPKECHQAVYLPGGGTYFLKSYARLAETMAAYPDVKLNYEVLAAMQEHGVDERAMMQLHAFVSELQSAGVLSADELPEYPVDPVSRLGYLVEKVARREGIGDALAEGVQRAAVRIDGRAEARTLTAMAAQHHGQNDAASIDNALGICPLLSSSKAQSGGEPPYHLQNLPGFISQAAGIEVDADALSEIAGRIREVIREINEGRCSGEEAAAARDAA